MRSSKQRSQRRFRLVWGPRPEEVRPEIPGDELLPDVPAMQAITIDHLKARSDPDAGAPGGADTYDC